VKAIVSGLKSVVTIRETSSFLMLFCVVLIFYLLLTVLMISGEFDLSVGSVFALCPIVLVLLVTSGFNLWLATFLSVALCWGVGALNGAITLGLGIPSFITTLGTMMAWRGIILLITGGWPPAFPEMILPRILVGQVGMIRTSLIWFALVTLILWILLERSRFGNWIFATGGNQQTARALGINPGRVKFVNFTIASTLAGLSGLIQACRIEATLPSLGMGLELQAIAAAVIGGTLLTGGVGTVTGSAIGCALIRIIDNGLVMARVPGYWFRVFIAIVLIAAVVLNTFVRERAHRMR